jgi:hypothetical protein
MFTLYLFPFWVCVALGTRGGGGGKEEEEAQEDDDDEYKLCVRNVSLYSEISPSKIYFRFIPVGYFKKLKATDLSSNPVHWYDLSKFST